MKGFPPWKSTSADDKEYYWQSDQPGSIEHSVNDVGALITPSARILLDGACRYRGTCPPPRQFRKPRSCNPAALQPQTREEKRKNAAYVLNVRMLTHFVDPRARGKECRQSRWYFRQLHRPHREPPLPPGFSATLTATVAVSTSPACDRCTPCKIR